MQDPTSLINIQILLLLALCKNIDLMIHDWMRGRITHHTETSKYNHFLRHSKQIKYISFISLIGYRNFINKAIRDGKYLALPHSSAWQRSPHFFRDVISLLARVFIFLIDRATQEVPIKKYLKEIVCHKFF